MKRMFSLLCVLALALTLCVSAFAEDTATSGQATSGQVGGDSGSSSSVSDSLAQDILNKDNPTVEDGVALASSIQAASSQVVTKAQVQAMRKILVAHGVRQSKTTAAGVGITAYKEPGSGELSIDVTAPTNNIFSVTGNVTGKQSALGYYIEVAVPASKIDTGKAYMWVNDRNEFGEVIVEVSGGTAHFQFYAPHFSTYTIADAETILALMNQSAANNSPLAKTNSDMNTMAVVVAAFVMGLVAFSAVELKKRSLSK